MKRASKPNEIQDIIIETLMLVCEKSVQFHEDLCIEGDLRLTIDQKEQLHVRVNENVISLSNDKNCRAQFSRSATSSSMLQAQRKRRHLALEGSSNGEWAAKQVKYEPMEDEAAERDVTHTVLQSLKDTLERTVPPDIKDITDTKELLSAGDGLANESAAKEEIVTVSDGVAYVSAVNILTRSIPVKLNESSGCFEPVLESKKARRSSGNSPRHSAAETPAKGVDGEVVVLDPPDNSGQGSGDVVIFLGAGKARNNAAVKSASLSRSYPPKSAEPVWSPGNSLPRTVTAHDSSFIEPFPVVQAVNAVSEPSYVSIVNTTHDGIANNVLEEPEGGDSFLIPDHTESPGTCAPVDAVVEEQGHDDLDDGAEVSAEQENSENKTAKATKQPKTQEYVEYINPIEGAPEPPATCSVDHSYTSVDGANQSLVCPKCGRKYQYGNAFLKHRRQCQKGRTVVKCPFCEARFMRRDNLKAHMSLLHNVKIWDIMKNKLADYLDK